MFINHEKTIKLQPITFQACINFQLYKFPKVNLIEAITEKEIVSFLKKCGSYHDCFIQIKLIWLVKCKEMLIIVENMKPKIVRFYLLLMRT